jgi:hypothetical protein
MAGRFLSLGAVITAGWLFGYGIASIPSPADPGEFWIANLSSPWIVLPFITGWLQRSRRWAAVAGIAADVASVFGFYWRFLTLDPIRLGLNTSAPAAAIVWTSLDHWLAFTAPWIGLAVITGLSYGILGRWWGRSGSLLAWIPIAVPFLVEPVLWRAYQGKLQGPTIIWLAEVAVGLGLLSVLGVAWQRRRLSH